MDNLLGQTQSIRSEGKFFLPGVPDLRTRHVATQDIANSAVNLLLDRSWDGQGGLAVLGPKDISFEDMALTMSDILQREIRFQRITGGAYRTQLVERGMNPAFADGLIRMFAAKANGLDNGEVRTAENTTPTTFREWVLQNLQPRLQASDQKQGA